MALGTYRILHALCMPAVYVLQLIPGLAWIPISLILFGTGEKTTIFMILITALPPVIISTTGGIRAVPKIYINVAQMIGLGRGETFFKVLLPASLLPIVNGLRIGFANGWRVIIAAEMVAIPTGIGALLMKAESLIRIDIVIVCLMVLALMCLSFERFFMFAEQRLTGRWK